jgi:Flp pilus assembly CpaF family ATPase
VSARVCPDTSEVMVNRPDDVYMERKGRIEKVAGVTCRV